MNAKLPHEEMESSPKIAVGECYNAPLIILTPLQQTVPILKNLNTREKTPLGAHHATLNNRYLQMAEITIIKRNIQTSHNKLAPAWNKTELDNRPAPHILETVTPMTLWGHLPTIEALSRAATPVQSSEHTHKCYEETFGNMVMQYDFDLCINYAQERVTYACENIQRESVTGRVP